MKDLESIRSDTISKKGDPQEESYKKLETWADEIRGQSVANTEKFRRIEENCQRLETSYQNLEVRVRDMEAFKNKLSGMGIIINLIVALVFSVVGFFIGHFMEGLRSFHIKEEVLMSNDDIRELLSLDDISPEKLIERVIFILEKSGRNRDVANFKKKTQEIICREKNSSIMKRRSTLNQIKGVVAVYFFDLDLLQDDNR